MSEEFSWDNDQTVIIKRANPIAVYTNPAGEVVIREQSTGSGDHPDDQIITIPLDRVQDLIAALSRELLAGTETASE